MNTIEASFVRDLIMLSVPFLLVSLILNLMKYALGCAVHPSRKREKKPLKSWCYDE